MRDCGTRQLPTTTTPAAVKGRGGESRAPRHGRRRLPPSTRGRRWVVGTAGSADLMPQHAFRASKLPKRQRTERKELSVKQGRD